MDFAERTRLGAGGPVRAYGGVAAECLRGGDRRPIVACVELRPACAFGDSGEVHAAVTASAAEKLDERYDTDGLRLHVRLPEAAVAGLKTRLRDATRGRVRIDDNG